MAPTGGTSTENMVSDINETNGLTKEYRVYKRRWFILIVVALLNISNAMVRTGHS